MRTRHSWTRAGLMALALLIGTTGCGDKIRDKVGAMNSSNIRRVCNMYAAFQNYKGGRGPKDEAEFKEFVRNFDPNKLSMMKIDPNNVDGLFTSERDGKPFKIRYKVGGARSSVAAVVFEEEGVSGKKQVGFTSGEPQYVDEDEYQQMLAGNGPSAPPSGPPSRPAPQNVRRGRGGSPSGPPPGAPTGPSGS